MPSMSKDYIYHKLQHSFPTRRSSDLLRFRPFQSIEAELGPMLVRIAAGIDLLLQSQQHQMPRLMRSEAGDLHVVRSEETRLNSSHMSISYAVFCLKKKNKTSLCRRWR